MKWITRERPKIDRSMPVAWWRGSDSSRSSDSEADVLPVAEKTARFVRHSGSRRTKRAVQLRAFLKSTNSRPSAAASRGDRARGRYFGHRTTPHPPASMRYRPVYRTLADDTN